MSQAKLLGIVAAFLLSFILAWVGTFIMKWLAPRIGFVDKPGHRKIHANPKPLGGGIAIFWAIALPLLGVLLGAKLGWFPADAKVHEAGVLHQAGAALRLLVALAIMHVMGLMDDRKAMGPYVKLVVQLVTAAYLVWSGDFRILTVLGDLPSIVLTVLWITGITNAFNFLDNMDGLSAGVAVVCAFAFLVTTLLIEQWFVAGMLAMLMGALVGFLCFNFPPASIFMGDSGSLVLGMLLACLTVKPQYLPPGSDIHKSWYALLTPVIVLAVPIYDLVVVSIIRILKGKSPFTGDTNHFSHRLVRRGMSRRTAVLTIWLVTAATSIAAIMLPRVPDWFDACLIFVQTALVLGVVALLEQHPLPVEEE
jgi:UDP-GlcNAc:undecaprenyl-phosphate GlcNAc-1-phosphate transferase